jgi:hypothetical protein
MEEFIRAIPAAASSPYAFAAYAIAALVFVFAGERIRMAKILLSRITSIPKNERRRALEIATGTILPTHISPEDWIRHNRMRWLFLLLGAVLIVILTISIIALLNPTKANIEELKKVTIDSAEKTQSVVKGSEEGTAKKIDSSTERIVTTVQDSALATLETMFPLAVRIDRDVDGTIMHLSGSPRQRIISYDKNNASMNLYWGDRFRYFAYGEGVRDLITSQGIFLEIRGAGSTKRLPLLLNPYSEQEIRIPGSSPEPMEAFLINESGLSGVSIKITVYSADRERGREEFRQALMNTSLDSAARRIYFELSSDGARLRSAPGSESAILRTMRKGTYVKIKERTSNNEWCKVRMPEGREGWTKCDLLKPIAP